MTEVVVKRQHAMDLGAREVENFRDNGDRVGRHPTESILHAVQHQHERAGTVLQGYGDGLDRRGIPILRNLHDLGSDLSIGKLPVRTSARTIRENEISGATLSRARVSARLRAVTARTAKQKC